MRRRLLNLLTALSLLLCVAFVTLWVRHWKPAMPADEPAGWRAQLHVLPRTVRPPSDPAQRGDVVTIVIGDLTGPGSLTEFVTRVGADGTASLPYVGRLNVGGLDSPQIESAVVTIFRQANLIGMATVNVSVAAGGLRVPYLLLVCASAVLPFAWALRYVATRRRRSKLAAGLCPTCGYNLTANTSGVCPECGQAAPTTTD